MSAQDLSQALKYGGPPARGIDLLQGFLHNWTFFPSCYENAESEIAEAQRGPWWEEPGLTLLSALNPELKNEVSFRVRRSDPKLALACKYLACLWDLETFHGLNVLSGCGGNLRRRPERSGIGCVNRDLEHIGNLLPCLALIHNLSFRYQEKSTAYFTYRNECHLERNIRCQS